MRQVNLLAWAGSTRRDSYNKRLVVYAARVAEELGARVTVLDLADHVVPLYDADVQHERGLPEAAQTWKAMMIESDGFLIASPEYNHSISGVMKNMLDWVSRREGADEPKLLAFKGKVAGLLSASPGRLGGLLGLRHVREILELVGTVVIPNQYAVAHADEVFDADGNLTDAAAAERVRGVVADLVRVTGNLQK